jgi:hypothetical protein
VLFDLIELELKINNSLAFIPIYDKLYEHALTFEQIKKNKIESIKFILNRMKSNKT